MRLPSVPMDTTMMLPLWIELPLSFLYAVLITWALMKLENHEPTQTTG